MRILLAGVVAAGVMATLSPVAATASAAPDDSRADGVRRQLAAGLQVAPKQAANTKAAPAPARVNPRLGLVADPSTVDYSYWRQVQKTQGAQRAAAARATARTRAAQQPILHDEKEPAAIRGSNDTPATAEVIAGFGTAARKNPKARILGKLTPDTPTISTLAPVAEDNGSIPLAGVTGVSASRTGVRTTGEIGDGPHGSAGDAKGDFDFYRLELKAGQQLVADLDTPTGGLDPVAVLYSATGTVIATNDDESPGNLDSLLSYQVQTAGTYYLMISGYGSGTILPADPFDSGSGLGVGKEGPYTLTVTAVFPDDDFYAVDLAGGDVIGASVTGAARKLSVYDPSGRLVFGSTQDASFIYPPVTPLPGGGNAVADHVAAKPGRYTLAVTSGGGTYDVTLEAYRPSPEAQQAGTVQTLFLDFDGARLNTATFGGPGVRQLSPLAGFLGRWGIGSADENALIDRVVATVRENIRRDLAERGLNDRFAVRILNSRDDEDPFGEPNVSRIVVGGTVAESGVDTIGIAQSIDPGNFAREETALVLLDYLSDPAPAAYSLNTYLTAASDRLAFVGQAVGNVVSHEAGHFYGNWHVDQFDTVANLMDQGGNFPILFGVGADNVGGTGDDVDVDFGEDTLNPNEGFTGIEDTLNTTAWSLPRSRGYGVPLG